MIWNLELKPTNAKTIDGMTDDYLDNIGRLDIPMTVLPCSPAYYERLLRVADENFRNAAEVFHAARNDRGDPDLDQCMVEERFEQAGHLHDMFFDVMIAARAAKLVVDDYSAATESDADATVEQYESIRRAIARLIDQDAKATIALLALC